jgi:carbohydrate-selective porin OprB
MEQAIGINAAIEIHKCANGYLVMPATNWAMRGGYQIEFNVFRVFQSFEALNEYLSEHFDHRSYKVPHDTK